MAKRQRGKKQVKKQIAWHKAIIGAVAIISAVLVVILVTNRSIRSSVVTGSGPTPISATSATPTSVPTPLPSDTPNPPATNRPATTPQPAANPTSAAGNTPTPAGGVTTKPLSYGYKIINTYPHDPTAFTQGLIYEDGMVYEGTGLRGQSTLRKVDLETGAVTQLRPLDPPFFGEGVTMFEDKIIQLTWQSNVGFVYDKDSFELLQEFHYPTEGWGLTHDGEYLIMSDGTANLYFLDPKTFEAVQRIEVHDQGVPVRLLNELEYIQGEVYANVWRTTRVARISPETGQLLGWIELAGLLGPEDLTRPVDVLNGIAYDAEHDRLFVTGKWWPKLFEIELVAPQ